ncbi:MAG: transposase, partial [Deltaproteobacteria bacterium]|nr:transposase [Deltaproteobacteria bacterium]
MALIIGYIKGESTIYVARTVGGRRRNLTGQQFWACGYWVSTVGRDEKAIQEC